MTHDQTLKETFHVAGDAPDPTGGALRGVSPGYDLTRTALGHPMLLYRVTGTSKEIILEADIYAIPGQPMYVHLICPLCLINGRTVGLKIDQSHKSLSYDVSSPVPTFPGWTNEQMKQAFPDGLGGRLSVEPFKCTWEETPDLKRLDGLACCRWQVAIDNNVVRDV